MQQLAIIGREKKLAYAELESVFGDIQKYGDYAVLFDSQEADSLSHLGSVIKIGKIISTVPADSRYTEQIISYLVTHFKQTQVNSIDFGISVYGDFMHGNDYKNLLIQVKKSLKRQGIKNRFVVPKHQELNAAQIKHNKLLRTGVEILLVQNDGEITIVHTTQIQDIDNYTKRDFGRPSRDMAVGMFPPKLAQIMLNLAQITPTTTVYDPFCGSGVVLQEAILRNNTVWGSDLSEEMVKASIQNLNWLSHEYSLSIPFDVFSTDATKLSKVPTELYSIITEGYLGTMLSVVPSEYQLQTLITELSRLYIEFLQACKKVSPQPENIVITLPCWQMSTRSDSQVEKLKIIDQIINLGYTIKQFKSVDSSELIYKRPTQIVGRQILVLEPAKHTVDS